MFIICYGAICHMNKTYTHTKYPFHLSPPDGVACQNTLTSVINKYTFLLNKLLSKNIKNWINYKWQNRARVKPWCVLRCET